MKIDINDIAYWMDAIRDEENHQRYHMLESFWHGQLKSKVWLCEELAKVTHATTNKIVIFGGWHPIRAALGCYLFAVLQLLALKLQPVLPQLSQVLPIIPFPLMIMTLLFINHQKIQHLVLKNNVFGRFISGRAPSALGESFQRL